MSDEGLISRTLVAGVRGRRCMRRLYLWVPLFWLHLFLEAYFFTFHILKTTFQHNLFHDLNLRHGFMLDEAHE